MLLALTLARFSVGFWQEIIRHLAPTPSFCWNILQNGIHEALIHRYAVLQRIRHIHGRANEDVT